MKITNIKEAETALNEFEKRITALESKKTVKEIIEKKSWYKLGGTTAKIVELIDEGYFKTTHTLAEMVVELKTKDYHLKVTDLTPSLRQIVHRKLLKKTKTRTDGTPSNKWLYVKV